MQQSSTMDNRTGVAAFHGREMVLVRVRARWNEAIREVCRYSTVPVQFLGALVANESAGDPNAVRFEPAVYRHLQRVAAGLAGRYGGLTRSGIEAEVADMLSTKSPAFHATHLTEAFSLAHAAGLASARDEALRELASSWGLTQIMGYHMAARAGTARDLLEPRFHFRVALELLAEFAERYQLDLGRDFEPMLRCWNTGQPYGSTTDPAYVEKGLRRMEQYQCVMG